MECGDNFLGGTKHGNILLGYSAGCLVLFIQYFRKCFASSLKNFTEWHWLWQRNSHNEGT